MQLFSRRKFVGGVMASLLSAKQANALAPLAVISDQAPELASAELERIFVDNSEPLEETYVVKGLGDWSLWWDQEPLEMARWPTDADTIDYSHLLTGDGAQPFLLNDLALRRIVDSHAYTESLENDNSLVLFGIRGAMRFDGTTHSLDFENQIEIRETMPDHFDYRCLLGVWNTANGKIWATQASTTPHVAYLYAQREASTFANEANMMPTGLYRYYIGTHRNATSSAQPGAFRPLNKAFSVLRCVNEGPIRLGRDQYWDTRTTNHGDNIHAGTYTSREDRPRYWSAGCQVVPGHYDVDNTLPQGNWARFRIAAGLKRKPVVVREEIAPNRYNIRSSEDGRRFSYILTTGRDISLAANNSAAATLRFGSSGIKVKALQAALGVSGNNIDGILGIGTQRLVLAENEHRVPIVDRRLAEKIGVEL